MAKISEEDRKAILHDLRPFVIDGKPSSGFHHVHRDTINKLGRAIGRPNLLDEINDAPHDSELRNKEYLRSLLAK